MENNQTYHHKSPIPGGVGEVNYQMQIVTKLPNEK